MKMEIKQTVKTTGKVRVIPKKDKNKKVNKDEFK
jgi:hypothetical protein